MCINKVNEVVGEYFNGEFIEFLQRADNGFDGVILWREKGSVIDVIYVQCKGVGIVIFLSILVGECEYLKMGLCVGLINL